MFAVSRQYFTLIVDSTNIPSNRLIKFLKTLEYIVDEPDIEVNINKSKCNTSLGL